MKAYFIDIWMGAKMLSKHQKVVSCSPREKYWFYPRNYLKTRRQVLTKAVLFHFKGIFRAALFQKEVPAPLLDSLWNKESLTESST